MRYAKVRVSSAEAPAPGYALVEFEAEEPFAGDPGQFVMARGEWGNDPVLPRAFSLVEAGARGAILVKAVGRGTRRIVASRPGDALFVLGPSGRGFSVPSKGDRPVLVAGGIGVAPLVFLAERLAEGGRRPVFLYGARSAGDLPLADRLGESCNLEIVTEDGSAGERGLVTAALERVLEEGGRPRVFACGPEGMLKAVAALAAPRGVPCEIAMESPMACGMGTCKACAVPAADGRYRYVCSDGPVFEACAIYGGCE